MLKVGIIGCGKIAQVRHIPEYLDNRNAQLAGFFDLNQARARELADRHGGEVFPTYQALLEQADIDAVSVCTANQSHAEITIAALRAGKHVLCEKPMAVTLAECEAMARTAQETDRVLLVGHNQRLTNAHRKAKALVANGAIGKLISVRTTFGHGGPETWSIDPGKSVWFFDKNLAAMGVIADLGIHKTDLIHFLTGQLIVETDAHLYTLDKRDVSGELIGVDDNALCLFRLNGGSIGTMTASWTFYGAEDNSTVLYGTQGIMRIYDDRNYSIKVITKEGEQILYEIDQIQTNDKQTKSGVIDEFVACILENRSSVISGDEALKTMRVIFASIESSLTGCPVQVNHSD